MAKRKAQNVTPVKKGLSVLQRKFLTAYEQDPFISRAASAAGIQRRSVWRWRKDDPVFAEAFAEAEELATQSLEEEALRRARSSSDTLLIFMLKAKRPEVYKDRVYNEHTGKDGGPIQSETKVDGLAGFLKDEAAMRQVRAIINRAITHEDGGRLNGHLNGHAG